MASQLDGPDDRLASSPKQDASIPRPRKPACLRCVIAIAASPAATRCYASRPGNLKCDKCHKGGRIELETPADLSDLAKTLIQATDEVMRTRGALAATKAKNTSKFENQVFEVSSLPFRCEVLPNSLLG